jgi:hypothetical protein
VIAANCLGRTAQRRSPEELYIFAKDYYASVKESVVTTTALRDRYLQYLNADLEIVRRRLRTERPAKRDRLAKLAELLAEVVEQDRPPRASSESLATQIAETRPASEPKVLSTLIAFANQDLATENDNRAWVERLLVVSPYSSSRSNLDSSLRDIQKDVREILMSLAAGDRWARTKEYAQLVYASKWPRKRGLELFNGKCSL